MVLSYDSALADKHLSDLPQVRLNCNMKTFFFSKNDTLQASHTIVTAKQRMWLAKLTGTV